MIREYPALDAERLRLDPDAILRVRCGGWEGYRNGRKHLVAVERLVDPRMDQFRRKVVVYATGPCPVCGMGGHTYYGELGPADRTNGYEVVGVKGTYMADKSCNASCLQSASAECKCKCGGADHGMYA